MCFARPAKGFMCSCYDDAGTLLPVRPCGWAEFQHFSALCRGFIVLIALGLPIGLTLIGITPPVDAEPEMIVRTAMSRTTPAPKPLVQALLSFEPF